MSKILPLEVSKLPSIVQVKISLLLMVLSHPLPFWGRCLITFLLKYLVQWTLQAEVAPGTHTAFLTAASASPALRASSGLQAGLPPPGQEAEVQSACHAEHWRELDTCPHVVAGTRKPSWWWGNSQACCWVRSHQPISLFCLALLHSSSVLHAGALIPFFSCRVFTTLSFVSPPP